MRQKAEKNKWQLGDWVQDDTDIRILPFLLELHMLKLKTNISLFGIVVLWLMCSRAGSKRQRTEGGGQK